MDYYGVRKFCKRLKVLRKENKMKQEQVVLSFLYIISRYSSIVKGGKAYEQGNI